MPISCGLREEKDNLPPYTPATHTHGRCHPSGCVLGCPFPFSFVTLPWEGLVFPKSAVQTWSWVRGLIWPPSCSWLKLTKRSTPASERHAYQARSRVAGSHSTSEQSWCGMFQNNNGQILLRTPQPQSYSESLILRFILSWPGALGHHHHPTSCHSGERTVCCSVQELAVGRGVCKSYTSDHTTCLVVAKRGEEERRQRTEYEAEGFVNINLKNQLAEQDWRRASQGRAGVVSSPIIHLILSHLPPMKTRFTSPKGGFSGVCGLKSPTKPEVYFETYSYPFWSWLFFWINFETKLT